MYESENSQWWKISSINHFIDEREVLYTDVVTETDWLPVGFSTESLWLLYKVQIKRKNPDVYASVSERLISREITAPV